MKTVFETFDKSMSAMVNPGDFIKPVPGFPKRCITTYSDKIIQEFAEKNKVKQIAALYSANGELPIYKMNYRGEEIAVFLSRVGGPASAAGLEEVIAMGADKIIMFGCCGILNSEKADNKIIVPLSAVREEGTSYHYVSPSHELKADVCVSEKIIQFLKTNKIPVVEGKVWSTDGIYRETRAKVEERKMAGCLAVEMEYAAMLAVSQFRGVSMGAFFMVRIALMEANGT